MLGRCLVRHCVLASRALHSPKHESCVYSLHQGLTFLYYVVFYFIVSVAPRRCVSQSDIQSLRPLMEDSLAKAVAPNRRHNCSAMPSQLAGDSGERGGSHRSHAARAAEPSHGHMSGSEQARKEAGVDEVDKTTVYRYLCFSPSVRVSLSPSLLPFPFPSLCPLPCPPPP